MSRKLRLLIADYPYPLKIKGSYRFTTNFVRIMQSFVDELIVVSDNVDEPKIYEDKNVILRPIGISPHFLNEISPKWLSLLLWAGSSSIIQLKIISNMVRYSGSFDIYITFMMHPVTETIPIFLARLLRKKVVKVPLGIAPTKSLYLPFLYRFLESINLRLINYFVPEYESNIDQLKFNGQLIYPQKMLPPAHFFLLEDKFTNHKKISERKNIIGYIGGFRKIKGVLNFVESIKLISNRNSESKFLIAGEGILKEEIIKSLSDFPADIVAMTEWIPHDKMPLYLNEIKLLVIPSFSEGVPNVAIEAMACGTPVLSTNVGVIPHLIKDGENGFILDNNSPEAISKRVLEIIEYDEAFLQKISDSAMNSIIKAYSVSSAVDRWKYVLNLVK